MRGPFVSTRTLPALRDARFWLLVAGFIGILAALFAPRFELTRSARDILLVVDITGSMNVRDYLEAGQPETRLDATKRAMRALVAALPCQSRVGLAIFTERRSFLLFEAAEVCANFSAVDGAIDTLNWRMAWEGDSHVARGIDSALETAAGLKADLVFLTDGQEAPPLTAGNLPSFSVEPGKVQGLLVGVGGLEPAPIPKFDDDGREIGFYGEADVPQENRSGPPPEDAASRAGWDPRNAPWGGEAASGTEHLSAVREDHLSAIAARTGLAYARLDLAPALIAEVMAATSPHQVRTSVDTAALPATFALLALLAVYAVLPLAAWWRASRQFPITRGYGP